MKETLELRIPEEYAIELLAPDVGIADGGVRELYLSPGDPLLDRLRMADEEWRNSGRALLLWWRMRRSYSPEELENAALLRLDISKTFEPAGEECGTVYDLSQTCPACGAGRRQASALGLDVAGLGRRPTDLGRTIAGDEWVVSSRLATVMVEHRITGVELRDVVGCSSPKIPVEGWRQLVVTSPPVRITRRTITGVHPLDLDTKGRYVCPLGDTRGLNVVSELWVDRRDWKGADFVVTREHIGVRRGLLVPHPVLLVSGRVLRLLRDGGFRGWRVEVVHLEEGDAE